MPTNCHIQTATPQLSQSQEFFTQIGFKPVGDNPMLWSDGKALIEINPDRFARPGIKLQKEDWSHEVATLRKITKVTPTAQGQLLSEPSGTWRYLVENETKPDFTFAEQPFGYLGNFVGLSLETTDMQRSADILETLGFKETMGSRDQGFVGLALGDFGLSLMKPLSCPHLFFSPSLTYFNGINNKAIIDNLRSRQVPFAEEITIFNKEGIVDNVVIRDPGGLGFFIFSD